MGTEELQEYLNREMEKENNRPLDDFEGYSPSEMEQILYNPFEEGSVVSLRDAAPEAYSRSPMYITMKALMDIIRREGQVRLTATGYLPPGFVVEIYNKGYFREAHIESGYLPLQKEADSDVISIARMILQAAKVITKRKSVLTLSRKGLALSDNEAGLFRHLFMTFINRLRWASLDDYGIEDVGWFGAAYSCILLDKYGDTANTYLFYAKKYLRAYPCLMEGYLEPSAGTLEEYFTICYCLRTFDRFLLYWGFIQYLPKKQNEPVCIVKTPLLNELILCKPPGNRLPPARDK